MRHTIFPTRSQPRPAAARTADSDDCEAQRGPRAKRAAADASPGGVEGRNVRHKELPPLEKAFSYFRMANVYNKTGKHAEALELYKKSLDINIEVHGQTHKNVASLYDGMAFVSRALGKYTEALELYTQSLDIRLKVHGLDHPHVANAYNGMANAYNRMGKHAEALALFEKSLAIMVKVHGADHHSVANAYIGIGNVYDGWGDSPEMRQKALEMWHLADTTTLRAEAKDLRAENDKLRTALAKIGEAMRT